MQAVERDRGIGPVRAADQARPGRPDAAAAAAAMGAKHEAAYTPDAERAAAYDALYAEYLSLHDYFGRGANEVMYRLRNIAHGARLAK